MSISGISTTSNPSTVNNFGQTATDFQSLAQALQSGNLAAAQQAFATLQQDSPWISRAVSGTAPATGTTASASSPLQALGKALQSGDLAGAQQAFAAVQQGRGGHHGHHHASSTASATATPPAAAPSVVGATGSTGSSLDIVA